MQCDVCQRRQLQLAAACDLSAECDSSSDKATAGGAGAAVAKLYCVDCCETLCKSCAASSTSSCRTAGHEIVKLRKASLDRNYCPR